MSNKEECLCPCCSDEEILDISGAIPNKYFLIFERMPKLIYFINSFSLPGIQNNSIDVQLPFHSPNFTFAGHTTNYGDLGFNFTVNSNFRNYFEMVNWIRLNEVADLARETTTNGFLFILNDDKIPIIRIWFSDVLPVNLDGIQFGNKNTETLSVSCTMKYYNYKVTYLDLNTDRSWNNQRQERSDSNELLTKMNYQLRQENLAASATR